MQKPDELVGKSDELVELSPRDQARWLIIQKCNRFKYEMAWRRSIRGVTPIPTLFSMKNINEAVFMARQRTLVDDDLLVAAGFNPRNHVG